jgi:hypothetical protein
MHFFEMRWYKACFRIKKPSPAFISTTVWREASSVYVVVLNFFICFCVIEIRLPDPAATP